MPQRYIWVNLPGYYLQLWDTDTMVFESKVICGKPATPTPLLTSMITDMVTYPTWTVPTSIIAKQYLPKLKNNPNYLARLGLKLVDRKGQPISGQSVNWSKYTKGIPYNVMQNSGDNNALGVMKFNFNNPYAVYLHDTNQRYLFKNASRAFSHGCVRVQEWEKLADYLIRNDSMNLKPGDSLRYSVDSVKTLLAEKKNRRIPVKSPVYLYITYFGCEGKDGKIKFYDDMYGDDKALREKYFTDK
jgi:murein L,D-transpeptidase YcbB/YkuD